MKYSCIGLGGSFDHFHAGHRAFISFAAQLADQILIGVASSKMIDRKQFANLIQPEALREKQVREFCSSQGFKATIVQLNDDFGPTLSQDSPVKAIAVTTQTETGGQAINFKRASLNLPPLPVHVFQLITDKRGQPINSTRIRAGQIDRQGRVYSGIIESGLTLTANQRQFFGQPQGEFVTQIATHSSGPIFVVGDVCLETFLNHQWHFDLGVYDGISQRRPTSDGTQVSRLTAARSCSNPPGQLSSELVTTLTDWFVNPFQTLRIEGEEDLAAVALCLLAPLGAKIYYGQANQGMVEMLVTEDLKQKCYDELAGKGQT